MKKQIRFSLLFALIAALLLGSLFVLPLAVSADNYTLIVRVVDQNGNLLGTGTYGLIRDNATGEAKDNFNPSYTRPEGTTLTLTAEANETYAFYGWMDNVNSGYKLANGDTLEITLDQSTMIVYAVFKPREYHIYYVSGANDPIGKYGTDSEYHPSYLEPISPTAHIYGTTTDLPTNVYVKLPSETQTHTFAGWMAFDPLGNEITLTNGKTVPADTRSDIYVVPQWTPAPCDAKRIDRAGTPEEFTELGEHTETVNYGALVSGKELGGETEYPGYRFDGENSENYTEAIADLGGTAVVYRYYTPREYQVTFDLNAPDENAVVTARGTEEMPVVYKQDLPETITIPACTGWDFLGYYYVTAAGKVLYYDSLGNIGNVRKWDHPEDATLVAEWRLQTHEVIVVALDQNGNDCSNAIEVLINGQPNPGAMDYQTAGTVQVTVLSGQNKKLTKWNGEAIAHTASSSEPFVIGEEDIIITVQLLVCEETPALQVNYQNETLEGFLPGEYRFASEGSEKTISVAANGAIATIDGETADRVSVAELFGKELQIVRLGTADQTADSDPQTLTPAARPAKIAKGEAECVVTETKRERGVSFRLRNGAEGIYEMAYTTAEGEIPENWSTELHLENLEIETPYTVYLRVRATETAPHGEATLMLENYEFSHLVDLQPLFIILLCLFALQILALALLLISRRRASMNAVGLPLAALLAIKTIPAGLFPWIIVLLVAIVAVQIALVWLAVQTGIVWKKREKKEENSGETEEPKQSEPAEFTLFGEETKQEPETPTEEDGSDRQE